MHEIEPYYNWRDYYIASEDKLSPFYRREYSEFNFTHQIYNYYIHPQWDSFGSTTLYCKILFADYERQFVVIELIGEWNDAIHNDILEMKNGLINPLLNQGIKKFILIGEHVLNFHASDDLYYEEWYEEIKDDGGWIIGLNFRDHVIQEMRRHKIHYYVHVGDEYNDVFWRKLKPEDILDFVEDLSMKSLR